MSEGGTRVDLEAVQPNIICIYHLLQIAEVKQERMTEIWDTFGTTDVHTVLVEISFSQSIPVETALLFRDAAVAPRMKCLLWHGIGGPLVTSKERLSVAAKQLVDDRGILLDQKCLPKKIR